MILKNKTKSRLASKAALVATLAIGSMAIVAISGCTASTKTVVDPAKIDATHGTRIERPGRTKTKTFELKIQPAPLEAPTPGASRGEPVGSLVAFIPEGQANAMSRSVEPVIRPVGWIKHGRPDQDIDTTIAEAIAQAARNGSSVELKITETEEIPLSADITESTLVDSGAGLDTRSDEAAIGFDGNKGGAKLPWGGKSGKTSWGLDASLFSKSVNAMHIIGAIVMLGAIVPLWAPPRRWTAAGAIVGVGLMIIAAGTVSEQAPWVFVLAILGFMGLAGWLGYESWRNKRRGIALNSIVRGVEMAGKDENDTVKSSIGVAAGDMLATVKAEVRATKNKLGARVESIRT